MEGCTCIVMCDSSALGNGTILNHVEYMHVFNRRNASTLKQRSKFIGSILCGEY